MSEKHAWLKPEQVEQLRATVYDERPTFLQGRDDALIALIYDAGLRVGEAVALNSENLDFADDVLRLPAEVQKDYPTDKSPDDATIRLSSQTTRTLRSYLNNRWIDPRALFPSRQSPRITERAVRELIPQLAGAADVRPFIGQTGRGVPDDVSPHTLRHSVAYRVIEREDGDIYDVKRRLRHASVQTTERVYAHFDVV